MTFDDYIEEAKKAGVDSVHQIVYASNAIWFDAQGKGPIVINGLNFVRPKSASDIRNWYRLFLEKVSILGDLYKDLFVACSLEPWVFLKYAKLPPGSIRIMVEEIKNVQRLRLQN